MLSSKTLLQTVFLSQLQFLCRMELLLLDVGWLDFGSRRQPGPGARLKLYETVNNNIQDDVVLIPFPLNRAPLFLTRGAPLRTSSRRLCGTGRALASANFISLTKITKNSTKWGFGPPYTNSPSLHFWKYDDITSIKNINIASEARRIFTYMF